MTIQQNDPVDDKSCQTGVRCAQCCELIPAGSDHEIHRREVNDVIYHFCGPDCYQRWQQRGNLDSSAAKNLSWKR